MTIMIIVAPIASSPGRFMAKLPNGDMLIASSRTPFVDAARRLIELGFPADGRVVMRHAGSTVDSLAATIGDAAALTVTTAGNGRPVFAVRAAAAPPIRSPKESLHPQRPRPKFALAGPLQLIPRLSRCTTAPP
jgi:hypothetical protein